MQSTAQQREANARLELKELEKLEQAFAEKLIVARKTHEEYTAVFSRSENNKFKNYVLNVGSNISKFGPKDKENYIEFFMNPKNSWNRLNRQTIGHQAAQYAVELLESSSKEEKAFEEFREAYTQWSIKYESLSYQINKHYGFFTFPSSGDLTDLVEGRAISRESQYGIPLEDAKKGAQPKRKVMSKETFLATLQSQRTKNLEDNLYQLYPEKVESKNLSYRLQHYINRIETYKTQDNNPDFTHGFWFFAESRAKNRKANYETAKLLLTKLEEDYAVGSKSTYRIFEKAANVRESYIDNASSRGINSSELNEIIETVLKR